MAIFVFAAAGLSLAFEPVPVLSRLNKAFGVESYSPNAA